MLGPIFKANDFTALEMKCHYCRHITLFTELIVVNYIMNSD